MSVNFDDLSFSEIRPAFLALQSENEALKARVDELEARAGVERPKGVKLRHFDSLEALEAAGEDAWDRIPEREAALADPTGFGMRLQMGFWPKWKREMGLHLPFRNVIVDGLGEVRRMGGTGWNAGEFSGGLQNPDVECIVAIRVLNLTNPIWMALVQPGDDKWEGDEIDRKALVAAYAQRVADGNASTRFSTKTWEMYPQYADYLSIFRDVYGGDHDPGNPKRPTVPVDV